MTTEDTDAVNANNRGAIVRLFGVILIILGGLNSMLSWRGGLEMVSFHSMLIVAGLLLCLVGAILKQRAGGNAQLAAASSAITERADESIIEARNL